MIALIITSLLGDYSGIAEEVEKQLQNQDKNQELKKSNIKLMEEVNKYRYFIECQKNEIEKL